MGNEEFVPRERLPTTKIFLEMLEIQKDLRAFEGVDVVVHAMFQQVPAAEYNPWIYKNQCTWCREGCSSFHR